VQAVITFMDGTPDFHGVEPICNAAKIAPSTHFYREAKRDVLLLPEIRRVHEAYFGGYGVQKRWRA